MEQLAVRCRDMALFASTDQLVPVECPTGHSLRLSSVQVMNCENLSDAFIFILDSSTLNSFQISFDRHGGIQAQSA